jgi:hypothetical protein
MCVLRVAGDDLRPDDFLRESTFTPTSVVRSDGRITQSNPRAFRPPGFAVAVSDADDPQRQFADAEAFLRDSSHELRRLLAPPHNASLELDFLVECSVGITTATQSVRFPASLVEAAGAAGVDLVVTLHPTTSETGKPDL